MNIPSIVLGIVLSTLYGAGFHLWRGGGLGRLIAYLLLGWAGFWVGNGVAILYNFDFGKVGSINVLTASILCFIFLGVGHWLSLSEPPKNKKGPRF